MEVEEQVQEKATWQALQEEFAGVTANDSKPKPQQQQTDPTKKTEGPPQGGQPDGGSSTPSGGEGGGAEQSAPTNAPAEDPPVDEPLVPDPAETPPADGTETPPEVTPEIPPEVTPTPEPKVEYYESDEEYYADFSKDIGYEVTSDEDTKELIKTLSNTDPYEKFSPFLKSAIEYEQKGGHAKEYFDKYVPVEGMTNKELFRQKWNQEHAAALAANPDFASQKFEREFKSRFDLLDTNMTEGDFEDSPEEYQQYLADKKFQEEELGFEAQSFKGEVDKMRETAFDGSPSFAPQELAMTPEEATEIAETYSNNVRSFQNDFEGIDLPLDPEGKETFTVGLNAKSQPIYEQWLSDPNKYLEFIGFDKETKTIDVSKFGPHVAMSAMLAVPGKESLGVQMRNFISEQKAENTVETKLEHPKDNAKPAPNLRPATSVAEQIDEIADAVAANYRPAV